MAPHCADPHSVPGKGLFSEQIIAHETGRKAPRRRLASLLPESGNVVHHSVLPSSDT